MNKEYCCVCQSKNRRAGLCDVIPKYLEELKTLRVELERNSKELEVYRRALEYACASLTYYAPERFGDYVKYYLQEARKE